MAGKDTGGTPTTPTQQERDNDEMAQFAGFSTVDGEVQRPKEAPDAPQGGKGKAPAPAAQAGDEEGEHDDGAGADNGGRPSKSAQERINKAVAKQRSAERRAEEAERRYQTLEQRLAALEGGGRQQQPQQQPQQQGPKAPNPKDYEGGEYDSRYIADVAKYSAALAAREEVQRHTQQQRQEQDSRTKAERAAEMAEKRDALTAKGAELYDDFEEVVFDDGVLLSQTIGELLLDSEHGAEIAYALASDPKEQKRIFGLSPARQAAWFGAREAELSSVSPDAGEQEEGEADEGQRRAPPPRVTKAPPAPKFNARGVGGSPRISADTSDFAAFERMAMGQK